MPVWYLLIAQVLFLMATAAVVSLVSVSWAISLFLIALHARGKKFTKSVLPALIVLRLEMAVSARLGSHLVCVHAKRAIMHLRIIPHVPHGI